MFITDLALPALFFQSLSQEDFRDTNLHMLSAVVIAKVGMLSSGWLFGRVAGSQSIAGSPQMYAGMFGLLSTNGDDDGRAFTSLKHIWSHQKWVCAIMGVPKNNNWRSKREQYLNE